MNLPKRKSYRLKGYDYSSDGAYFITVCTYKKQKILSRIVGAIHESPVAEIPKPELTVYGNIAENFIREIPDRYGVKIDNYVIMPNHIHIIIKIDDGDGLRVIRESPLHSRSIISKAVGYMKMNVSKEIHKINPDEKVWQRSFHDHIIRGEKDYEKIWNYIESNPMLWKKDCFYE